MTWISRFREGVVCVILDIWMSLLNQNLDEVSSKAKVKTRPLWLDFLYLERKWITMTWLSIFREEVVCGHFSHMNFSTKSKFICSTSFHHFHQTWILYSRYRARASYDTLEPYYIFLERSFLCTYRSYFLWGSSCCGFEIRF